MLGQLAFLFSLPACSGLFYHPDRTLYFPYEKSGFPGREIVFSASDGTKLFAWYFPAQGKSRGTVAFFHGNAENISSHYLSLVWITKRGYGLFIFDYRGYGKSEGDPDQEGTYLDGLAALKQAHALHEKAHGKNGAFIVYGQSLGGAIATRALQDFELRRDVRLLALDSTFLSYRGVARKKMVGFWLTWPLSPLAGVLVSDAYAATEPWKGLSTKVLVIHDEKDSAVPFACGEEIFEEAPEPKDFWILRDGNHGAVFAEGHPERREQFLKELDALTSRPN